MIRSARVVRTPVPALVPLLRRLRSLMAAGIALCSAPLCAHDLWIEPGTFTPRMGQVVSVGLRVGQNLDGERLPLIPSLVNQFIVQDAAERRPVAGRPGADPAGLLRVARPGLHVVGYHSHPSRVALAADTFNAYLAEEGLEAIADVRASRHESGTVARELYARCAKSLLLAGPPSEAQRDQALGFPLELVAERNPYATRAGQDFPVRLSFAQQPLAGALVVAMNNLQPSAGQSARTDADGRVRFTLRPGGMWLVKAVHMVAAAPGTDADWASYWASLTFEVRAADDVPQR